MNLDLSPLAQTIAAQVANELAPLLRRRPDQWMTTKEAAEYLRCSPNKVSMMACERKLPGHKLDGTWRFSRQELDSFLKA